MLTVLYQIEEKENQNKGRKFKHSFLFLGLDKKWYAKYQANHY